MLVVVLGVPCQPRSGQSTVEGDQTCSRLPRTGYPTLSKLPAHIRTACVYPYCRHALLSVPTHTHACYPLQFSSGGKNKRLFTVAKLTEVLTDPLFTMLTIYVHHLWSVISPRVCGCRKRCTRCQTACEKIMSLQIMPTELMAACTTVAWVWWKPCLFSQDELEGRSVVV